MKKILLQHGITGLLVMAILFIVFTNIQHRNITKDLKKDKIKLTNELSKNDSIIKVLNDKIKLQNKYYIELLNTKSKINIKYETKFKDISNVNIVSNDSIMRYISSKIHNQF